LASQHHDAPGIATAESVSDDVGARPKNMAQMSVQANCPAPEILAQMAEGRLGGADRARLVAHLARCPDCHVVLAEAARYLDAHQTTGRPWVGGSASRRRWASGLAAAAGLAAVILVVIRVPRHSPEPAPVSSAESSGPPRTVRSGPPSWVTDAPWESAPRLAFAPSSTQAKSAWVGLHLGALDRVCATTDGDIARMVRTRVALSLREATPAAWVSAVSSPVACRSGRVEASALAQVDARWLTLGRLLERWRIAAAEHDERAIEAADRASLDRLVRELPLSPAARRSLELTLSRAAGTQSTRSNWDEFGNAVLDSIEVLIS
jgi:Putative zinc-finger